jgi:prephenate dehydrogenase
MKAGIIGGTGKMGRLFEPVFERAGYDVMVSGRSTQLTNTRLAEQCDLVIVSVPIRDTVPVIKEIAPVLTRDQLLCDFTSLKVAPVTAMLKSEAQVIGLHPLFGPTVQSLLHQTIIVCPVRATEESVSSLLAIFGREGAECTISTPDEHDRMMAVVQGLTHFVTLCMAESIRRMGIDINTTRAFTSPVYQIELSLVGRLLSQDPSLYADILQQNPYVPGVLSACTDSAGDLRNIVLSKNTRRFNDFFLEDRRHLGPWCDEGMKATDALIDCMVNR